MKPPLKGKLLDSPVKLGKGAQVCQKYTPGRAFLLERSKLPATRMTKQECLTTGKLPTAGAKCIAWSSSVLLPRSGTSLEPRMAYPTGGIWSEWNTTFRKMMANRWHHIPYPSVSPELQILCMQTCADHEFADVL